MRIGKHCPAGNRISPLRSFIICLFATSFSKTANTVSIPYRVKIVFSNETLHIFYRENQGQQKNSREDNRT